MSWENRNEWHIDHIMPISMAKTYDEVIRLNHYRNLRPLWAHENLSKSDKTPKELVLF
jgi:CRISPR/Cas system Type II protein with McrA/HNH and RuvC-like nuclease domain